MSIVVVCGTESKHFEESVRGGGGFADRRRDGSGFADCRCKAGACDCDKKDRAGACDGDKVVEPEVGFEPTAC
jgi:hypothetical protein